MSTGRDPAIEVIKWSQQPFARRVRDFLRFVSLPWRWRVSTIYDLISTSNYFTERTLFRNLGYWKDAPATLDDACEAMAQLAGDSAALSANDRLLDVGFGFGDQDMYWMEHFKPREIVGINVTESQLTLARQRVAERGMSDRISLQLASATQLPFPAGSFDKVIALESAFHFDTRDDFFREAFRVLRPGGRIVLLDIIAPHNQKPTLWQRLDLKLACRIWHINPKNLYRRDVYADKLRAAGFASADVQSIRPHVDPHFVRFARAQLEKPEVRGRFNPAAIALLLGGRQANVAATGAELDYVLAIADKA